MKSITRFVIPSIADIIFLIIFINLSFNQGGELLQDCDTGYHIRAGEFILNSLSVPGHDIFSFLTPAIPWTAHEWLSEVLMAMVHRVSGLTGVVIFFSLLIAFIYFLMFKAARTYRGNILISVLIVLIVIASSQIHWLARPHIFSLLLTFIWYYLLDEYQYKNKNYLYFFPPLMLLWVNLHGGFIMAFVLLGIYLIYNFVKFCLSDGSEKAEYGKKKNLLGLTIVACLLVSLINPYGYHIVLFPFKLISNSFIMDHVNEFLSPNFHESMPFKYLLFLMIAIFAFSSKRLNIIELAIVLIFTNMALYSARYIPLFAIIIAPILIKQGELILNQTDGKFARFFRKRGERIASVDKYAKGYLWLIGSVLLIGILTLTGKIEYRFDEEKKPVAAVEFLKKEHIKGHMFNNDEFGDYIIYAAWPEYKVFFDGRSDMYGAERMKEYFKVTGVERGWDNVLKKYDMNWIFYDANSFLSRFLLERVDWKLIYADKVADIFVRNTPEYQHLIDKYKNVKPVAVEEKVDKAK
jgi:hypothetical protein